MNDSDLQNLEKANTLIDQVYFNSEKGYAFLEFSSILLCSACMALHGIVWKNVALKVRFVIIIIVFMMILNSLFLTFVLTYITYFTRSIRLILHFFNSSLYSFFSNRLSALMIMTLLKYHHLPHHQ